MGTLRLKLGRNFTNIENWRKLGPKILREMSVGRSAVSLRRSGRERVTAMCHLYGHICGARWEVRTTEPFHSPHSGSNKSLGYHSRLQGSGSIAQILIPSENPFLFCPHDPPNKPKSQKWSFRHYCATVREQRLLLPCSQNIDSLERNKIFSFHSALFL